MSGPPVKGDTLSEKAIARGGYAHGSLGVIRTAAVNHDGHIDIVKVPQLHQLGLAGQKGRLALAHKVHAIFNFDVFLCRHRKKDYVTPQRIGHPRFDKPISGAQQTGNLRVVTAGVGRSRLAIGPRVIGHDQRIQFPHEGYRRSIPSSVEACLDPCECELVFKGQPKVAKHRAYLICGLPFLEPEFGLVHNSLTGPNDFISPPVNSLADRLFHRVFIHNVPNALRSDTHRPVSVPSNGADWVWRLLRSPLTPFTLVGRSAPSTPTRRAAFLLFTILLFDSNASFSTTFANLLRNSGYEVETAQTLQEATDNYRTQPFDLVVLGLDGSSKLEEALQPFAPTKAILLLTDRTQRNSRSSLRLNGRDTPAFYKPFRTEEVLATIYATLVSSSGDS